MEKNSLETEPHIDNWSLTKGQRHYDGKKAVFSTNSAEHTHTHTNLDTNLQPFIKFNLK